MIDFSLRMWLLIGYFMLVWLPMVVLTITFLVLYNRHENARRDWEREHPGEDPWQAFDVERQKETTS